MRHGRLYITMLAAVAGMAIGPAYAAAATSSLVDDSTADFGAGTHGPDITVGDPGAVRLTRTAAPETFDTTLPTDFSVESGTPTVTGGQLTVDGAFVRGVQSLLPDQPLVFTGTFGTATREHVGLAGAGSLDTGPWAIFSTGNSIDGLFYARTSNGVDPEQETLISGYDVSQAHTFRIEWTADAVRYFINDVLVATHNGVIAGPMHVVMSDAAAGGSVVGIDSLDQGVVAPTGTFESRVLDTQDATSTFGTLSADVVAPSATDVTFQTRSGPNATPGSSGWSNWAPVNGGAIASPGARYIQYQAVLTAGTATNHVTRSVNRVSIGYTDAAGPDTTMADAQVSGTSATVAFGSSAADLDRFECSLDGGAPATCTSPYAVNGLAPGAHTVTVRGVDKLGNVGPNAAKTFTIASPVTSGGTTGTTQQSGTGSSTTAADKTKPKVSVVAKSLKASKKGAVSFTVGCPATEQSCKFTLKLKNGKKIAASKTVNVKGGKSKTVTLTLDKATRKLLAKRHTLKVSTVVTAVDAAGNKRTTTKQATLRRAAG
jgi:uncharacterized cupredoxin-like copper-binding protein